MKNSIETLTEIEADKLTYELDTHTDTTASRTRAARNRLMAMLMLKAGLRIGELTQLRVEDLIFQGSPVLSLIMRKEITKGKTERIIPLHTDTRAAITRCTEIVWLNYPLLDTNWAFPAASGKGPISSRQVQNIFESAGRKALGRHIHPHMLRHTFASRLMRVTNIRVVQQLLGHKNIQTTQIYLHPNQDDLTNAINGIDNAETKKES